MKTAGKHMAVGSEVVRGGWAGASGGWARGSSLGWMLGGGNRAVSGGSRAVSIGSRAATAIAALAAGVVVTGCGGGGDDGPATSGSAAVSTEKPVEQPILTMPTSTYTGMHAEAFKRINEARIAAGVSALKQSVELDRAAQAHSDYQVRNNVFGHYEDPAHPLFTGATPRDRAVAQKYPNTFKVEVVGFVPSTFSGANHVDLHLNSVYHLQGILNPATNEVGMGFGATNSGALQTFGSLSLGVTDIRLQPARNPFFWPASGNTNVPTAFSPATEVPNPLPDVAPNVTISVGPPIMFCQSLSNTATLQITSASMRAATTKSVEPTWLLKSSVANVQGSAHPDIRSDSVLSNYDAQCIFLIAKSPLQSQTSYEATVVSTHNGISRETTWSFSTR